MGRDRVCDVYSGARFCSVREHKSQCLNFVSFHPLSTVKCEYAGERLFPVTMACQDACSGQVKSLLSVCMALVLVAHCVDTAVNSTDCVTYEDHLQSRPDFVNKVVYKQSTLPPIYAIHSVELDSNRKRSFYWCELTIQDETHSKTYRHFGHNATHWWVERGCGAWFFITACMENATVSQVTPQPTNHQHVTDVVTDVKANPIGHVETKPLPMEQRRKQSGPEITYLNEDAVNSLMTWLNTQDHPIEEKLGAHPNSRKVRSVDEEFELEFGFK